MGNLMKRFLYNKGFIITVIFPILLLPLLFINETEVVEGRNITKFRCAYVIILMAVYWMTEALPLAVTSLIPVVLFPMFGILDTEEVTIAYMKETNMMFVGGLIIALGMEYSNLHRRIALKVMSIVGGAPIRLLFGVMMTTMFLSMWMSNTAATAMMVPIVVAVLDELHKSGTLHGAPRFSQTVRPDAAFDAENVDIEHQEDIEAEKRRVNTKKMYLFAVAYSANIGGTGVITGSGTNLAFQQLIKANNFDVSQGGRYTDINFSTWFLLNAPIMLVNVLIAFAYLTLIYFGAPNWLRCRKLSRQEAEDEKQKTKKVTKFIIEKYKELGSMNFHEGAVAVLFVSIVLLWFTREPGFMPGWGEQIPHVEVGDSTAAIFVVFLLFAIPKDLSVFSSDMPKQNPGGLLSWKHVHQHLPWGAVFLLGGGFAISDAAVASGLSNWIGESMKGLEALDSWVILLVVMILTAAITEVTSNVATANILIPILISLSQSINVHPLYLTIGASIACSYAFMFPVATPPNAIVFSAGGLTIMDMVKTGAFLNFSCVLVFFLLNISYGNLIFDYDNYEYLNTTTTPTF